MAVSSILDKALYSTLRIETRGTNGEAGGATAFIFEYRTPENNYPFMVTARGPVTDVTEGRITLLQAKDGKPLTGKGYTLDIDHFEKLWYCHPDDELGVAITPFVPFVRHVENTGTPVFFHALTQELDDSRQGLAHVQLADDIISIGYEQRYFDRKSLMPMVRRGSVATAADSNYMGKSRFLVNTRVEPGAEGGPVFHRRSGQTGEQGAPFLAGMLLPAIVSDPDAAGEMSREMGQVVRIEVVIETISAYLKDKGFI